MGAIATSLLTGLGAALSANLLTAIGRRMRDALTTPERTKAFQRCVGTGVDAMLLTCVEGSQIEVDHIRGVLEAFFADEDVAAELAVLLRGGMPDAQELAYLFEGKGGDAETLAGMAFAIGHNVHAVVHAVNQVYVGVARRPEHRLVARGQPARGVRGQVMRSEVGFDLDDAADSRQSVRDMHQQLAEQVLCDGLCVAVIE